MEQDPESEEEVMLKQEDDLGGGNGLGWPANQEPEAFDDLIF